MYNCPREDLFLVYLISTTKDLPCVPKSLLRLRNRLLYWSIVNRKHIAFIYTILICLKTPVRRKLASDWSFSTLLRNDSRQQVRSMCDAILVAGVTFHMVPRIKTGSASPGAMCKFNEVDPSFRGRTKESKNKLGKIIITNLRQEFEGRVTANPFRSIRLQWASEIPWKQTVVWSLGNTVTGAGEREQNRKDKIRLFRWNTFHHGNLVYYTVTWVDRRVVSRCSPVHISVLNILCYVQKWLKVLGIRSKYGWMTASLFCSERGSKFAGRTGRCNEMIKSEMEWNWKRFKEGIDM